MVIEVTISRAQGRREGIEDLEKTDEVAAPRMEVRMMADEGDHRERQEVTPRLARRTLTAKDGKYRVLEKRPGRRRVGASKERIGKE